MADPYDQDDHDIMGFSQLRPSQRREKDVFKRRMARLQQFKEQASNRGSELSRREENAWINHGTPIDWEMHRPSNEVVAEQIEAKTGVPKEEFTDVSPAEQKYIEEHTANGTDFHTIDAPNRLLFHPELLKQLYDVKENKGLVAKTLYTGAIVGGSFTPVDKLLDTIELQMALVMGDEKLLGEALYGYTPTGDVVKAFGRFTGVIEDYKDTYSDVMSDEEIVRLGQQGQIFEAALQEIKRGALSVSDSYRFVMEGVGGIVSETVAPEGSTLQKEYHRMARPHTIMSSSRYPDEPFEPPESKRYSVSEFDQ